MKKSYAEKLRDVRWQKKKTEIQMRDKFICQACGARDDEVHVHHTYYERDRAPWDYPSDSLVLLCSVCHTNIREVTSILGKQLHLPKAVNCVAGLVSVLWQLQTASARTNLTKLLFTLAEQPSLIAECQAHADSALAPRYST